MSSRLSGSGDNAYQLYIEIERVGGYQRLGQGKVGSLAEAEAWCLKPRLSAVARSKVQPGWLLTATYEDKKFKSIDADGDVQPIERVACFSKIHIARPLTLFTVTQYGAGFRGSPMETLASLESNLFKKVNRDPRDWVDIDSWGREASASQLIYACEGVPRQVLVDIACKMARRSLHLSTANHRVLLLAIEAAERWTMGEESVEVVDRAAEDAYLENKANYNDPYHLDASPANASRAAQECYPGTDTAATAAVAIAAYTAVYENGCHVADELAAMSAADTADATAADPSVVRQNVKLPEVVYGYWYSRST